MILEPKSVRFFTSQQQAESTLQFIMDHKLWGVDTETTGLSPIDDKVVSFQMANTQKDVLIFDTRSIRMDWLKPFFESQEHRKYLHNAKFDYKMCRGTFGLRMETVRCSYLAETILENGKAFSPHKLDEVARKRIDVDMSKALQKSFITQGTQPFSDDQIRYMANDVLVLIPIAQEQQRRLISADLLKTYAIECDAIPAFGDLEFDGALLDVNRWSMNMESNLAIRARLEKKMNVLAKNGFEKNLFGEVEQLNFQSPQQVRDVLKSLKIVVPVTDRQTGKVTYEPINKTDADTLNSVRDQHEIVNLILRYRTLGVKLNTFGKQYIDAINPKTGRIHPSFYQNGTTNGRPSSGDSEVNQLNIPRDALYRNCFTCEDDEWVESDDFNACEPRILAGVSGDNVMKDVFNRDEDIHCFVASNIFGRTVAKDNENKIYREYAKPLNFGICYGKTEYSFHEELANMGYVIPYGQAKELYSSFRKLFKTAMDYLEDAARSASNNGVIQSANGRKRYFQIPSSDDPKARGKIWSIQREAKNFVISSINSDITKMSMMAIRSHALKFGIRTKLMNCVYDEIVTTTNKDDHHKFHPDKCWIMSDVAQSVIPDVKFRVGSAVAPYWSKG